MRFIATIIFITVLTPFVFGQAKDNGQPLVDKFFDLYKSSGHEAALKYAFGTNPWMSTRGDEVKNVIFELDKTINLVGNFIGYEEIKSKTVGTRFRTTSYFVYYERQPLRFTFNLYKNNDGWMIWNFQFDTNFDDEIEEGLKLSEKN